MSNFVDNEDYIEKYTESANNSATGILMPVGSIIFRPATSNTQNPPDGYLLCNGASHFRSTYSRLYAAIGTSFGAGGGNTTFQVPNYDDRFLMGGDSSLTLGHNYVGGNTIYISSNNIPSHTHSFTSPGHDHQYYYTSYGHQFYNDDFNGVGPSMSNADDHHMEASGANNAFTQTEYTNAKISFISTTAGSGSSATSIIPLHNDVIAYIKY
jgi:microcystin-dependent protein